MALQDLENAVSDKVKLATQHAINCVKLINESGLEPAIKYCKQQGIEPPQCSFTAQSANADKDRATASRMLGEVKWWARRLKNNAIGNYENDQRKQGKVTNYISDDLRAYDQKKRK